MPIHEYACTCGQEFEALVRSSDASPVQCPGCYSSDNLTQLFSTFATRNESIHTSERPVIFHNPKTGEVRTPATRDQPLHPTYAAQGFVRKEAFTTFSERDTYEKTTGKLHERTHYDPGSATAERDLAPKDMNQSNLDRFKAKRVHARL
jgi:putative FmdB family regulatory protein